VETPTFFILCTQHRAIINNKVAVRQKRRKNRALVLSLRHSFSLSLSPLLLPIIVSLCLSLPFSPRGKSYSCSGILYREKGYCRLLDINCSDLWSLLHLYFIFVPTGRTDVLSGAATVDLDPMQYDLHFILISAQNGYFYQPSLTIIREDDNFEKKKSVQWNKYYTLFSTWLINFLSEEESYIFF